MSEEASLPPDPEVSMDREIIESESPSLGNEPAPPSQVEEVMEVESAEIPNPEAAAMEALQSSVSEIVERIAVFPRTLRNIGQKVDSMAHNISEPRYRDILNGLLSLYDLIGQLAKSAETLSEGDDSEGRHIKNYRTIRTQIFQMLTSNGFTEIEAVGNFDPELHCAVESVSVSDEEKHNVILEVVRSGFKTESHILRYADVKVGKYSHESKDSSEEEVPPPPVD